MQTRRHISPVHAPAPAADSGGAWRGKKLPHAPPKFRLSPQPEQIKNLTQVQNNAHAPPENRASSATRAPQPGESTAKKRGGCKYEPPLFSPLPGSRITNTPAW